MRPYLYLRGTPEEHQSDRQAQQKGSLNVRAPHTAHEGNNQTKIRPSSNFPFCRIVATAISLPVRPEGIEPSCPKTGRSLWSSERAMGKHPASAISPRARHRGILRVGPAPRQITTPYISQLLPGICHTVTTVSHFTIDGRALRNKNPSPGWSWAFQRHVYVTLPIPS